MWLLPRVVDGEAPVRPRMKDARYGEPVVAELRGTLPHEPTPSGCVARACASTGWSHRAGTLSAPGCSLGPHSKRSGQLRPASAIPLVRGSASAFGAVAPP